MHATAAWYKLFNIRHSIGSYHHMYSIMSLIGRDTTVENADGATISSMNAINTTSYTSSNAYVHEWKECTPGSKNKSTHQNATNALLTEMHEGYCTNNYQKVHGVLCFSMANKKYDDVSRSSFSTTTSVSAPQGHNLMCTLHIYPIFATPSLDKPAATADEPPTTITKKALSTLGSVTSDNSNSLRSHRGGILGSSPVRELPSSAISSSLPSVNTSGLHSPVPHETPVLRRSNTQMSHTSFASTVRSSMRPTETDAPRPVYYAILFNELSEQVKEETASVGEGSTAQATAAAAASGRGGRVSTDSGSGGGSGGSGGSGISGTLQALIPESLLSIGRIWSIDKSKEDSATGLSGTGSGAGSREVSKHDYQQVVAANSTTYSSGFRNGGGSFSMPSDRNSKENRHSFS